MALVQKAQNTAVLREAWAPLPESSSRPLTATLAQSRILDHASLETAVYTPQIESRIPICLRENLS